MRALDYALREGWRGLRRSGTAGILATAATGLAMLVLGVILLLTSNVARLVEQWSAAAEFSVFLSDEVTPDQRGHIEDEIDRSGIALERTYVSKVDALNRFRREFANLDALAASLEDNPFPASLEVRVSPEVERAGGTSAFVERVGTLPGVADVRYDREWLATLTGGLRAVRGVGWAVGLIVALAAAATVASVIRLGMQGRYQEIEIMQLVGSPVEFIQGPFVAEGLMQGGLGAMAAITILGAGYLAMTRWLGSTVSAVLDGGSLVFLSPATLFFLVLGGMAVGAAGGFIASRHAR